jgi:hypothetical protein
MRFTGPNYSAAETGRRGGLTTMERAGASPLSSPTPTCSESGLKRQAQSANAAHIIRNTIRMPAVIITAATSSTPIVRRSSAWSSSNGANVRDFLERVTEAT